MDNMKKILDSLKGLTADGHHVTLTLTTDGLLVEVKQGNAPAPARKATTAASRVPSGETITQKGHTSKWWSRYNFEKNVFKIVFHQLGETSPATRYLSTQVADTMAYLLCLRPATCKRHITRSIKMGILIKETEGNKTYLSLNDKYNDNPGRDDEYQEILP